MFDQAENHRYHRYRYMRVRWRYSMILCSNLYIHSDNRSHRLHKYRHSDMGASHRLQTYIDNVYMS